MLQSKEIAFSQIATIGESMVSRFSAYSAFRSILTLRPAVVGFLTLVLAVAAWGVGYKISLYQIHSGTRSIVAKLWDKQHSSQLKEVSVARTKFSPRQSPVDRIFVRDPRQYPSTEIAFLGILPRIPLSLISVKYHLPFRSPPFSNLA